MAYYPQTERPKRHPMGIHPMEHDPTDRDNDRQLFGGRWRSLRHVSFVMKSIFARCGLYYKSSSLFLRFFRRHLA